MKKFRSFLPVYFLLALLALLAGLWAGLLRMGWVLPDIQISLAMAHGPLMVAGFLGTVIALERVVALQQSWMFLVPLCTGLGWVFSLALPGTGIGPGLITLGSLGLVLILGIMIRREPAIHTFTIGIGTVAWLVGNILWLAGFSIFQVVFWWAAFLVLTITGERLELSRVLRMTRVKQALFLICAGLFLSGIILGLFASQPGAWVTGLGMLGLAIWLLWFDLARRNLRHRIPLTRFIARCLYAGYFWLGVSGLLSLGFGAVFAGPAYDAVLHSIFVGFVISMIFGHAPIILPALTQRMIPFHPSFYASLILLHFSLAIRIAGDLGGWYALRQWGGLLNEVSILLFLGILVITLGRPSGHKAGIKS
jgi:hypothetical protein